MQLDENGKECEVWRETDRYTIYDCNGKLKGKDKKIKKSLTNGTFAVRKGSGQRDTKKVLKYIGGMDKYINKGDKVYIKSSFSFISDSPNSDILDRVIKECKKAGAEKVAIIDNDTPSRKFLNDLIIKSGYYDTIKDKEIPVHNIDKSEKIPFKSYGSEFSLPKFLFEKNAKLINIAPMRHDLISGVSLGQKNLVDLVKPADIYNNDEEKLITGINKILNPDLTILDGSRSCLSAYPLSCKNDDGDFLLVSDDPVCADAWGSKIMFYPVNKVEHIVQSDKERVGKINCLEAKKSANPISVAKGKWKQLAPSPKIVNDFSDSYRKIKDAIGGKKSSDLWAKTLVPVFDKIND
jgi:uncharacterized protein (DUF362 family)